MKMRIASGIVSRDLARALDLDLEHDRRALGRALVQLRAQRAVAAPGVLGVLEEVALEHAAVELDVVEEVVVARRAPPPARGERVVAETASSSSGTRSSSVRISVPLPTPEGPVMTKTFPGNGA